MRIEQQPTKKKMMKQNERNRIDHMATLINGYAHDLRVSVLNAHFK